MADNEAAYSKGTDMSAVMTIPPMYTDDIGDSRFDTYEVDMELHDHAPPAAPFFLSEPITASKYILFRLPVGWVGDRHPTPNYRLVICLAGSIKFIASTGETLILSPGDRMMDMNTTGKGHATEVMSPHAAEGIIIRVDYATRLTRLEEVGEIVPVDWGLAF
jgi:hypothetical protein